MIENKLAQEVYRQINDGNPDLSADEFLMLFNKLTADNRCLIPKNYPLTQKEFQIKFMYEKYA